MTTDPVLSGTSLPLDQLQEIVAMLKAGNAEASSQDFWLDAAITGTFSFSSGGAQLQGWITYYDGTKVHFELESVTDKTGTAAGTFAVPLIRVRPADTYAGKSGAFELEGLWAVGSLALKGPNGPIMQSRIAVLSAAPLNYELKGSVRYTKA